MSKTFNTQEDRIEDLDRKEQNMMMNQADGIPDENKQIVY